MDTLKKALQTVKGRSEKPRNIPFPVQLLSSTYPLNNSLSKYVSVGLQTHSGFPPVISLRGNKNDWAKFDENEWKTFVDNQGVICNYFYSYGLQFPPVIVGRKTLYFQEVQKKKVIRISDPDGSEVYLGAESAEELWQLLPIVEFRLTKLKSSDFYNYYNTTIKGVVDLPGDSHSNIVALLQSLSQDTQSDNVAALFELLRYASEVVKCDIEIERCTKNLSE